MIRFSLTIIKIIGVIRGWFTWVSSGNQSMEDSKAILSIPVGCIVSEFTKFLEFWANVGVIVGTNSCLLHIEPEAVSICSCYGVVDEDVISICDPPSARSLISVQETVRCSCQNG